MLKDRIVLLDNEISKLKATCGEMYKRITFHGRTDFQTDYDLSIERLSVMITERVVIKEMIDAGSP